MNWIKAHAKYVTALIGALSVIGLEVSGVAHWLPSLVAALTAAGVYQIPNLPPAGKP